MSAVIKNPSPKSRFQDTPSRVTKHRDMIASTEFELAADFGMLHYVGQLASGVNPTNPTFNDYAVIGVKVCGALEFLQSMRLLAESRPPIQVQTTDNLDHRA